MNKLIGIILLLLVSSSLGEKNKKVFRLAHDNYKPYHWFDEEQQKAVGIFIDLCDEILGKRMGYTVVYTQYPWRRAQYNVKNSVDDAYISIPTPERLTYIAVGKEPLITMKTVAFTAVTNPKIEEIKKVKTVQDLHPFLVIDYLGNGWAEENLVKKGGLTLEYSKTIDIVLRKLAVGRGDVFIQEPKVVHYNLKLLELSDKVVELPIVFDQTFFKLCISQNSPFSTDLDAIDSTIRETIKDGTYQKILDKWK